MDDSGQLISDVAKDLRLGLKGAESDAFEAGSAIECSTAVSRAGERKEGPVEFAELRNDASNAAPVTTRRR